MSVIQTRYQCGECKILHDDECDARECCAPEVREVFLCPVCKEFYDVDMDALACHGFDANHPPPPSAWELELAGQLRLIP